MLIGLTIRDIVLIDRLQIPVPEGLSVLSGETGAGKSILLDSLGLATGQRGERELVRHGAEQGVVIAEFSLPADLPLWSLLEEQGLDYEPGELILKRTLSGEGRSRAFVNDQPVSIGLLRQLGEMLVEIHGQHDERGLLNPAGHRAMLDEYGNYRKELAAVAGTYEKLVSLKEELRAEQDKMAEAQRDEEYIRYNLEELETLDPQEGEEEELSERRAHMMKGEKLSDGLNEVLSDLLNDKGADASLRGALRRLERMADQSEGLLESVVQSLDRAAIETAEAIAGLEQVVRDLEFDPQDLEHSEERLFALRAAARKHSCQVDQLAALKEDFAARLRALEFGDEEIRRLTAEVRQAEEAFRQAVGALSEARHKAADRLDKLVNAELPPLKLEKAKFRTTLTPMAEEDWNASGGEKVEFEISTNPGAPFAGLIKIASGGELSRFILALKVVLATENTVPTLIFDEIDRGVGGAVADAVGERLKRLSEHAQIMVITHSPQVAARGNSHWLIQKRQLGAAEQMNTTITALDEEARREEIARMLAGATVTDEARAAAASLMQG
ncbi:DNA repair protein RecN [Emcibacter nanhaiensis]|uniref:DNA repair protein RecN n=1 Tax=Emcibacter nanhaiensis TaxID=1505037 RepID=UPI0015E389B2|nr:DNA repair protein RecN [Emcibacter nanhaiensis]